MTYPVSDKIISLFKIALNLKRKHFFVFFLFLLLGCNQTKQEITTYKIGRDPSWYPLQLGKITADINAFTNALVDKIAQEENVSLQLIESNWAQLGVDFRQGNFDAILTPITPSVETTQWYSFSEPFLLLGPVLVVREDSTATSLEDLSEGVVGVYEFDDSVLLAQENSSLLIQTYQNIPTALKDLANGSLDAVLLANLDAHSLVPQLFPNLLKIVSQPLTNKGLRLATLKEDQHGLVTIFNQGLDRLKKKSWFKRLKKRFSISS